MRVTEYEKKQASLDRYFAKQQKIEQAISKMNPDISRAIIGVSPSVLGSMGKTSAVAQFEEHRALARPAFEVISAAANALANSPIAGLHRIYYSAIDNACEIIKKSGFLSAVERMNDMANIFKQQTGYAEFLQNIPRPVQSPRITIESKSILPQFPIKVSDVTRSLNMRDGIDNITPVVSPFSIFYREDNTVKNILRKTNFKLEDFYSEVVEALNTFATSGSTVNTFGFCAMCRTLLEKLLRNICNDEEEVVSWLKVKDLKICVRGSKSTIYGKLEYAFGINELSKDFGNYNKSLKEAIKSTYDDLCSIHELGIDITPGIASSILKTIEALIYSCSDYLEQRRLNTLSNHDIV